nr:T6SS effector amidase Tae4 family protein [Pseudomaricurvus alcaniphilus]
MTSDTSGRSLQYTTFDKPKLISKGGHTTEFKYGPNRARYLRTDTDTNGTTVTRYIGSVEKVTKPDGSQVIKRYIGDALVTISKSSSGTETARTTQYLYKDHLGSLDVIVEGGNTQEYRFDAWGQRINPSTSAVLANIATDINFSVATIATTRGFTGHEMLDQVGLIHMNGRIYDAKLGRFWQADPFVDGKFNTQGYNRYSYGKNNPLSGIDPSGYGFFSEVFDDILGITESPILNAVAQVAACYFGGPWGCAAYASASARGHGASWGDALRAGATAYISAQAFSAIGGADFGAYDAFIRPLAHGLVGGIMSELQGGKFGHGFVSAGLTKAINVNGIVGIDADLAAVRVVTAAVIGGTISEATGGKFANGAVTAAFGQLFNGEQQAANERNAQNRPSYAEMEKNYPEGKAKDVFEAVGGKVAVNGKIPVEKGGWANSCTVRISVCLNASGADIPFMKGETSSGANGKWHMYRVRTLEGYLTESWGAPDVLSTNIADFSGQKGILIFDTTGTWTDASGHATLWNGSSTVDGSNYFNSSSRVMLWALPD